MDPVWTASPNFTGGRPFGVAFIVDHWTVSGADSARATLTSPASGVSAHFMVRRDGVVEQYVRVEDRAWHTGSPDDADVQAGFQSWNDVSIGIEHEHIPGQDWPTVQLRASALLHARLSAEWGIPLTRDWVVGHNETGYATQCPGDLPFVALLIDYTVLGDTTRTLPDEPQFPRDLVSLYETLAPRAGIRAEIAFAQMLKETDRWRFTGIARPEWNNPAGLGVTGAPDIGNRFPTVEDGVRAQLGHLLWYFGPHIPEFCDKDQRHFGDHKNLPNDIRQLNGRWAVPGDNYGERIAAIAAAFEEEDMDTAELERRIDAKIAEYGSRLQPELEVDRRRIDSLEKRIDSINVTGEHDHEGIATVTFKTGGPVKR